MTSVIIHMASSIQPQRPWVETVEEAMVDHAIQCMFWVVAFGWPEHGMAIIIRAAAPVGGKGRRHERRGC